jgi:ABC-type Mn2+/Zn2+ transport system permease subunit
MNKNKRLAGILLTMGILLMVPLVAMQFTNEVDWSLFDFVVMGSLLLIVGLTAEFSLRKIKTTKNRIIAIAIILFIFLLIWAELAVGVFGTPFAGS